MGKAITSIGKYAFSGCTQLRELAIPEKVITLGEGAFASCQSLESITIPVGLNHAISTSHTTALFEGATLSQFYGCSALTSVTIKVPSINAGFTAWIDNDLLKTNAITEIILAEGVDDIGDGTFKDKASLERVILPINASRIGSAAFQNCTGLKEISIGRGTASIAGNAFDGCKNLSAINIAAGNTAYTSKEGLLFNKSGEILLKCPEGKTGACALAEGVTTINGNAFRNCALLTGISIPEGVTGISGHAFTQCVSLTGITLPDSITSIGSHAFSTCTGLTEFIIPEAVTTVGAFAFAGCDGLKVMTIGESVASIGTAAFSDCKNLTSVKVLGKGIPEGTDVFNNSPARVYYPPGAQGWGTVWNGKLLRPVAEEP